MKIEAAHYPSASSRRTDAIVHAIGLSCAVLGAATCLILVVVQQADVGEITAMAVYSIGLIAMFVFSTAYNFAEPVRRPFLRRLDHAGVFLMIASSYTPFTTQLLTGNWAIGMTVAVWMLASLGILGKLLLRDLGKLYWLGLYLALGWLVVIAIEPLTRVLSLKALVLLVGGGFVYSVGTLFYANRRLEFRRAIWHAHVIFAAGMHYFAILLGVVLKAPIR